MDREEPSGGMRGSAGEARQVLSKTQTDIGSRSMLIENG